MKQLQTKKIMSINEFGVLHTIFTHKIYIHTAAVDIRHLAPISVVDTTIRLILKKMLNNDSIMINKERNIYSITELGMDELKKFKTLIYFLQRNMR